MTTHIRPIHSGFETLRHAREISRLARGYHHFGSVTNEQLTARGYGRTTRPTAIFADFALVKETPHVAGAIHRQHSGTATMNRKFQSVINTVRDFLFQIAVAVNAAAEFKRTYGLDRARPHYQSPAQRAAAGIPL